MLTDQLATHAGMLHRVLGHKYANAVNGAAKHFGKQLTGTQQQGFYARRRMLALNQMKI
jgi:hypothetical protein